MKRQNRGKLVLGITGSFGTGKSTVAKIFASCGAKIIDADRIASEVIKPGRKIYYRVCRAFGKKILSGDRQIDRRKLAGIVFKNKESLRKLNSIVHPAVISIILDKINNQNKGVIVLDAPLLIEAGLQGVVDKLVVVKTKRATQIERIRKKSNLDKDSIIRRIRSQLPLKRKEGLADFIIDNNGSVAETRKQVKDICKKLRIIPRPAVAGLGISRSAI